MYNILQDVKIQFDAANDEGTIFGSITKDGLNDIKVLIPVSDLILDFEKNISKVDKILCRQLSMLLNLNELLLSRMTKVDSEIETVER